MKLRHLFTGACALLLLLPLPVAAEYINVYPGPDEEWNYLYDYGDVEVGQSGVMIFQIENDVTAPDHLLIEDIYIEGTGPFTITEAPNFPDLLPLAPGESIYVEVTFTPGAEGLEEGVMRILSNASNIPPGPNIPYGLQGTGVADLTPEQMMLDLIDYYDTAIADESLWGKSRGQSGTSTDALFRDMLVDIYDLIVAGNDPKACRALSKAMLRIDGASSPPDLVFGPSADVVYSKLAAVFNALECD
jgi:hypothetical protein